MTMLSDKKVLELKLQKAIAYARERIAIQEQTNQSLNLPSKDHFARL